MSIDTIRAYLRCDGCGRAITVDLDTAYVPPVGWSLMDCAVDEVRGGTCREGWCSVQSDQCLCSACTAIVDQAVPEDRPATEAEISAALGKAA